MIFTYPTAGDEIDVMLRRHEMALWGHDRHHFNASACSCPCELHELLEGTMLARQRYRKARGYREARLPHGDLSFFGTDLKNSPQEVRR